MEWSWAPLPPVRNMSKTTLRLNRDVIRKGFSNRGYYVQSTHCKFSKVDHISNLTSQPTEFDILNFTKQGLIWIFLDFQR